MAKQALSMREKALGDSSPALVSEISVLAEVYSSEKRYNDAVPLYARALAILEKTRESDHPEIIHAHVPAFGEALTSQREFQRGGATLPDGV